jgi:hypothetical protein
MRSFRCDLFISVNSSEVFVVFYQINDEHSSLVHFVFAFRIEILKLIPSKYLLLKWQLPLLRSLSVIQQLNNVSSKFFQNTLQLVLLLQSCKL